jgi:hypothetical protein
VTPIQKHLHPVPPARHNQMVLARAEQSLTTNSQRAALECLIRVAQGDLGRSRIVANFLLAWWNAGECGGFDLTDVWRVDAALAADMQQVFALVVTCQHYPSTLGYGKQFEAIVRAWSSGFAREAKALQLYAAKEVQNFEAERQCAKVRIRAERRAWRIGPRTTAGGPAGETARFSALIVLACSRVSTQSAICPRVH